MQRAKTAIKVNEMKCIDRKKFEKKTTTVQRVSTEDTCIECIDEKCHIAFGFFVPPSSFTLNCVRLRCTSLQTLNEQYGAKIRCHDT